MAFGKKGNGDFNTSYLPHFGNINFDTLMRTTLDNADMAAEQSEQQEKIENIVSGYRDGSLSVINCGELTALIDSVQDDELKGTLEQQKDAIVKHNRFNAEFAVKMKNFKPYDKGKRMAYADSMLDETKSYPSTNTLNIVLANCSTLAKAEQKLEELEKRGVYLNAKGLDTLLGLAKNKEDATRLFLSHYQKTGVNKFIMNKMIKVQDGVEEARSLIEHYFAVTGLQLDHGSLLSLVSCSNSAEEADHVISSLGEHVGYSNYLINARLKHDDNIADLEATVKRIEGLAQAAGQNVVANSDSFALMTKKLIDAGDISTAQYYLKRTEKVRAKENRKPNSFINYLKKSLSANKEEEPEKTVSPDKL